MQLCWHYIQKSRGPKFTCDRKVIGNRLAEINRGRECPGLQCTVIASISGYGVRQNTALSSSIAYYLQNQIGNGNFRFSDTSLIVTYFLCHELSGVRFRCTHECFEMFRCITPSSVKWVERKGKKHDVLCVKAVGGITRGHYGGWQKFVTSQNVPTKMSPPNRWYLIPAVISYTKGRQVEEHGSDKRKKLQKPIVCACVYKRPCISYMYIVIGS